MQPEIFKIFNLLFHLFQIVCIFVIIFIFLQQNKLLKNYLKDFEFVENDSSTYLSTYFNKNLNQQVNIELNYFKRLHQSVLYFSIALMFFILFKFIYLKIFLPLDLFQLMLVFTCFLYHIERLDIHELSRKTMLQILLFALLISHVLALVFNASMQNNNVHALNNFYLLLMHLITVAMSFAAVVAILFHGAVMMWHKYQLKYQFKNQSKNQFKNQSNNYQSRIYLPSLQTLEHIFLKRLNFLFYILIFVLLTGIVLIIDLHISNSINSTALTSTNIHQHYFLFYLKLISSFVLWFAIFILRLYQKRYGLAVSKIWYTSLILLSLWLLSYFLANVSVLQSIQKI